MDTSKDYWDEVEATAEAVAEEIRGGKDEVEALAEAIDQHEYVIYTRGNYEIMYWKRVKSLAWNCQRTVQQAAYAIFFLDVQDRLSRMDTNSPSEEAG